MKVTRWAKIEDWSPTSSKQVLGYLKSRKYPIPINRKTKKPTSGEEALEKILRKHPTDLVIPKILAARRLQKADAYLSDTYVGLDGRFHPEFTRHPETLRFSSRRPNIQNQPKGKKDAEALIAEAILSSIIAEPGYVLIERDYKAEEALLLGYFAEDELYMRAARLGIYSWLLGPKLGKPVDLNRPDAEVLKDLNEIKYGNPFLYSVYKTCTLGVGYGMGVKSLATRLEPYFVDEAKSIALDQAKSKRWFKDVNPELPFESPQLVELTFNLTTELAKTAALDFQKNFEAAAPKVVAFQSKIRDQAHKERKLTNPFGYCVAPETKILTNDLRWVRADSLKPGDGLLAFDEEVPKGKRSRQFRESVVEAATPTIKDRFEVTLSDGTKVVTTEEHPWLAQQCPNGGFNVWTPTSKLRPGKTRVLKALNVWKTDDSYEAGWLAGFFDGEGSWSLSRAGAGHSTLTAAQLPGPTLDYAEEAAARLGIKCRKSLRLDTTKTGTLIIHNGLAGHLEFLGRIRPKRLLAKLPGRSLGELQRLDVVRVVSVVALGPGPITMLQTSTRTYIAEGFAMHNCRHFYDVFTKRDGKWVLGSEAEKVLAFLPQSTGAGIMSECLISVDEIFGQDPGFNPAITEHDKIVCEVYESNWQNYQKALREVMDAPIHQLGGLTIETEGKWGYSWGEMESCA